MKIKIRYTWARKGDGHIFQVIVPIDCLEGNGDKPFLGNDLWVLLGRDLYTGINGKNEVEIYGGDIIMLPKQQSPCLVEWHNEGHGFRLVKYADKKVWKSGWVQLAYSIGYTYNGEKCEVIGNLYQDSELLLNTTQCQEK